MNMSNNPNDGRRVGDTCPVCVGKLELRQNATTKGWFLGCDQFPTCKWSCCPHAKDVTAVRVKRRKRLERRRNYAINRDHINAARLEDLWDREDERSRSAFLTHEEWHPDDAEPEYETVRLWWI